MQGDSEGPIDALRGTFRIGSRVKRGAREDWLELGTLRVFPSRAGDQDVANGQWVLSIAADRDGNHRERFFIEVASRLGLLPVRFTQSFEEILRRDNPLCIVADTNTLYHGTLAQALRVREGRATHVAIADVAMMEMQRQRERAWTPSGSGKKQQAEGTSAIPEASANEPSINEHWSRAADRSRFLATGGRTLERLRKAGHVVHVARPQAAMVRYFGGSRDTADEDDGGGDGDTVGSNLLRDRLILEAAFQQRINLPGVQLVLLTDDALLAEQAKIEGLTVGFGWLTNTIRPRFLTSPYIDPRTLELKHVPLRDFIDELVWSCSVLTLQRENEGNLLVGRVPEERRERVLAAMGEQGFKVRWSNQSTNEIWEPSIFSADSVRTERTEEHSLAKGGTVATVPKKSPSALRLLERVLLWLAGAESVASKGWKAEEGQVTDAYLEALGWLAAQEGEKALTERGRALASRWQRLDPKNVQGWVDWMLDAGADLDRLAPVRATLRVVETQPGITDTRLAKLTGDSDRTLSAQMNLAAAFGRAIRLSAKNWTGASWTDEDAEQAILRGIETSEAASSSGLRSVLAARLFTSFLPEKPMSLPVFRAALNRLRGAGRLRFTGSSPEEVGVKIRVLEPMREDPYVAVREVDLGRGDFLLPGVPCVVVEPADSPRTKQEGA
ncbi:hypothetical protein [Polyangium fumosum]|uniref:PIN domain-containing protein n=1 Tax=Polyangium fumosum TaxID=889272 RepID=A0A4U1IW26_9BACT|nr:hypothetical protein [Polyangium fumosum]TKC98732.1 hypothetical protein E8A74_40220 [Polyangium fumosum]